MASANTVYSSNNDRIAALVIAGQLHVFEKDNRLCCFPLSQLRSTDTLELSLSPAVGERWVFVSVVVATSPTSTSFLLISVERVEWKAFSIEECGLLLPSVSRGTPVHIRQCQFLSFVASGSNLPGDLELRCALRLSNCIRIVTMRIALRDSPHQITSVAVEWECEGWYSGFGMCPASNHLCAARENRAYLWLWNAQDLTFQRSRILLHPSAILRMEWQHVNMGNLLCTWCRRNDESTTAIRIYTVIPSRETLLSDTQALERFEAGKEEWFDVSRALSKTPDPDVSVTQHQQVHLVKVLECSSSFSAILRHVPSKESSRTTCLELLHANDNGEVTSRILRFSAFSPFLADRRCSYVSLAQHFIDDCGKVVHCVFRPASDLQQNSLTPFTAADSFRQIEGLFQFENGCVVLLLLAVAKADARVIRFYSGHLLARPGIPCESLMAHLPESSLSLSVVHIRNARGVEVVLWSGKERLRALHRWKVELSQEDAAAHIDGLVSLDPLKYVLRYHMENAPSMSGCSIILQLEIAVNSLMDQWKSLQPEISKSFTKHELPQHSQVTPAIPSLYSLVVKTPSADDGCEWPHPVPLAEAPFNSQFKVQQPLYYEVQNESDSMRVSIFDVTRQRSFNWAVAVDCVPDAIQIEPCSLQDTFVLVTTAQCTLRAYVLQLGSDEVHEYFAIRTVARCLAPIKCLGLIAAGCILEGRKHILVCFGRASIDRCVSRIISVRGEAHEIVDFALFCPDGRLLCAVLFSSRLCIAHLDAADVRSTIQSEDYVQLLELPMGYELWQSAPTGASSPFFGLHVDNFTGCVQVLDRSGFWDPMVPQDVIDTKQSALCLPHYHPDVILAQIAESHDKAVLRSLHLLHDSIATLRTLQQKSTRFLVANETDEAPELFVPPANATEVLEIAQNDALARSEDAEMVRLCEELSEELPNQPLALLSTREQLCLLCVIHAIRDLHNTPDRADFAGMRFLFSWKMRCYAIKLKIPHFGELTGRSACWAQQSESQELLLSAVLAEGGIISWKEFHTTGIAVWAKSLIHLRNGVEKLAKVQFAQHRDPTICAMAYVLCGKTAMLATLCKAVNNTRLHSFFSRDFSSSRNRSSASSNAFVALSKGNLEYSIAFFVLAGEIKMAIDIILQRTNNWMFALLVARLATNDDAELLSMLLSQVEESGGEFWSWWRCAMLWRCGRHMEALQTLGVACREPEALTFIRSVCNTNPIVARRFNDALPFREHCALAASIVHHHKSCRFITLAIASTLYLCRVFEGAQQDSKPETPVSLKSPFPSMIGSIPVQACASLPQANVDTGMLALGGWSDDEDEFGFSEMPKPDADAQMTLDALGSLNRSFTKNFLEVLNDSERSHIRCARFVALDQLCSLLGVLVGHRSVLKRKFCLHEATTIELLDEDATTSLLTWTQEEKVCSAVEELMHQPVFPLTFIPPSAVRHNCHVLLLPREAGASVEERHQHAMYLVVKHVKNAFFFLHHEASSHEHRSVTQIVRLFEHALKELQLCVNWVVTFSTLSSSGDIAALLGAAMFTTFSAAASASNNYALALAIIFTPLPFTDVRAGGASVSVALREYVFKVRAKCDEVRHGMTEIPAMSEKSQRLIFALFRNYVSLVIRRHIVLRTLPTHLVSALLLYHSVRLHLITLRICLPELRLDLPHEALDQLIQSFADAHLFRTEHANLAMRGLRTMCADYLRSAEEIPRCWFETSLRAILKEMRTEIHSVEFTEQAPYVQELVDFLVGGTDDSPQRRSLPVGASAELLFRAGILCSTASSRRKTYIAHALKGQEFLRHSVEVAVTPHVVACCYDHSTFDNLALATPKGVQIVAGVRDKIVDDEDRQELGNLQDERNFAMFTFAASKTAKAMYTTVQQDTEKKRSGMPPAKWVEAHPHLPVFLAGGCDGSISLLPFSADPCIGSASYRGPLYRGVACGASFSPHGHSFAVGDNIGYVAAWKFSSEEDVASPLVSVRCFQEVSAVSFLSSDRTLVAAAGLQKNVGRLETSLRLVDLLSGKPVLTREIPIPHVTQLHRYRDSQLIIAGKEGEFVLFDLRRGTVPQTSKSIFSDIGKTSPSGKTLLHSCVSRKHGLLVTVSEDVLAWPLDDFASSLVEEGQTVPSSPVYLHEFMPPARKLLPSWAQTGFSMDALSASFGASSLFLLSAQGHVLSFPIFNEATKQLFA